MTYVSAPLLHQRRNRCNRRRRIIQHGQSQASIHRSGS
jgi:hypothetical protein